MKTFKLGVIGSGFGLYGLLPAFNSLESCEVVAICGKKTERLLEYCRDIGLSNIYSHWESMLDKEKLDAVAIAVSPREQYKIAKVAINKGLNIFAEKPLAVNYAQARQMLDWAKKRKIVNAVDFIFPEIDVWQKAKQLLDSKALGELKHIFVNWNFLSFDIKNKISSWKTDIGEGGGALSFYFSHSLYYLEYYAGEILEIKSELLYAKESINKGEVGIDLLLKFKNGVDGSADLSCNSRALSRHRLIFKCEKGEIILENSGSVVDNFILTIYEGGKKEIFKSNDQTVNNEDERVKIVRKLASRFIEACARDEQMIPSFSEGLRVQELIEEIRKE